VTKNSVSKERKNSDSNVKNKYKRSLIKDKSSCLINTSNINSTVDDIKISPMKRIRVHFKSNHEASVIYLGSL
jgi:hypothetical protein